MPESYLSSRSILRLRPRRGHAVFHCRELRSHRPALCRYLYLSILWMFCENKIHRTICPQYRRCVWLLEKPGLFSRAFGRPISGLPNNVLGPFDLHSIRTGRLYIPHAGKPSLDSPGSELIRMRAWPPERRWLVHTALRCHRCYSLSSYLKS